MGVDKKKINSGLLTIRQTRTANLTIERFFCRRADLGRKSERDW